MSNAGDDLLHEPAADSRIDEPRHLRRASDHTPLGSIIEAIERAFGQGDYPLVAELLDRDPLAAWYGMRPERLGQMIETLSRAGAELNLFLRVMGRMLSGASDGDFEPHDLAAGLAAPSMPPESAAIAGQMFSLRLQGRPVEAMRLAEILGQGGSLQPLFDVQRGWGLFGSLQTGVTAMLAGDLATASTQFTRARMHVLVPHLAFLTRDASVKAAMLEALFGDQSRARALLDEAEGIPRTESWAEGVIDAGAIIAAALVHTQSPEEGKRILATAPLHEVGEMWPFYVAAVHHLMLASGDLAEGRRQVEMFEQLPLPRVEGQGYSGSVLLLVRAWDAIARGDLVDAREKIGRADGAIAITRIVAARLELAVGRPREAMRLVEGLHEQVGGFRSLELQRIAVIAGSHLSLGDADNCRAALEFTLALPGGLAPHEVQNFTPEVQRFAQAALQGWPVDEQRSNGDYDFPTGVPLTARELDVLGELSGGRSREEIASSQYISLNTLKAHLRSIYRKLGVNSRAAAILEAERRGII